MGNFGKKFIALVAAVIAAFAGTGCSDNGQQFAKTPEEEYDRICSMDGDGVIFDLYSVNKLQIKQTVHLDSPLLREANGGNATEETTLFQLDRSDKKTEASYGETNYISSLYLPNLTENEKIVFNSVKYGYKNGFDWFGRQFTNGYDEYAGAQSTQTAPDVIFRTSIKLLPREKLENMSGGKSGRVYTISADVKSTEFAAFYEWFTCFYPFIHHTNDDGSENFYDISGIKSVTFQIKSTRTQLSEISFSAVAPANPDKFGEDAKDESGNVKELVTINAKTEFSRSGFEITAKDEHGHW